eukprot:CAMPEP_0196591702 /NCGR_PEP_ID=MMETSP1081-20130531/70614_1 /TAXON_ID=36882 /ORGANISM="Pyramimonas amylifera, Strain CCMP720" /LENGTH=132 /DNA_ID=CAMNT_0041915145 /DNA_START=145 /DNA_END=540 /DNA_ORIENTATION=-
MKEEVTGVYPPLHADAVLKAISECTRITTLKLRNREQITESGAKELRKLANLTNADVINLRISPKGWEAFYSLSLLTSFQCSGLGAREEGYAPLMLDGLRSLKKLRLGADDMTNAELDGLSTLTSLTSLDLW